jgi:hypothetical protein
MKQSLHSFSLQSGRQQTASALTKYQSRAAKIATHKKTEYDDVWSHILQTYSDYLIRY